jgi:hypothetical protein
MAFLGMQPIGSLIIGLVAHIIGAQLTVMLEGVAGAIAVLLFIPTLKRARILAERKAVVVDTMQ